MLISSSSFYFKNILLANAGIPLFSQSLFYQVLLLIPIIVIEAYIHRKLLKTGVFKAVWVAFSTNVISTVVGGLLVILPIGALTGTILFGSTVPVQPGSFPFLPLEIIFTLLPMFWFSVVVESFIGSLSLRKVDYRKVKQSFLVANVYTYLMLEILAITQLIKGYVERRG
ncbi:hypothetical protein H6F93_23610 [Leptolyngbya sp. FACHB-671]|uniref:hypothetical protein n=1 Tax=unclassified Leptolyngbya TaxID=2650499 RepID=UPI0016826163|nr:MULTISPECIES: hypothetical protein [unclassified Leptolyngbya]MBD2000605.1 hypothetical protein [Leptolyngbya sp. FACHB-541]MBD2070461.1 hypothetical protein [Leptolyngbya sp. FACHB-671]